MPARLSRPDWAVVDLLSDVHLSPRTPRTRELLLAHLARTPADAVFILGDLFELWVGDDLACAASPAEPGSAQPEPTQAEADWAAQTLRALQDVSRSRWLGFMPGNRDFLFGAQGLRQAGLHALSDPTVLEACGQQWLLSHGDALCVDDREYQGFRALVRSPEWQRDFLGLALAERLRRGRAMRDASAEHQRAQTSSGWADVDPEATAQWLQASGPEVQGLIHGHTHRPGTHALPDGRMRHVLGDWDAEGPHPRARMLRLSHRGLQSLEASEGRP